MSVVVFLTVLVVVRAKARLSAAERSAVSIGTTWLMAGFGITVFLPVRSSLYALLPSVGGVIVFSAVVGALWREATQRQRRTLQIIAIALPLCTVPILKARSARWTELMGVTRITLQAIVPSIASPPSVLLLVDDRDRRDNLENAFRFHLPDAVELYTGQRPEVWIVPVPSIALPSEAERVPASVSLAWRYQNGRIERVPARGWIGTAALRMR